MSLHDSSAQILLDNGAEVNARTNVGDTPLVHAVAAMNVEHVRLLLSRGADVKARTQSVPTAQEPDVSLLALARYLSATLPATSSRKDFVPRYTQIIKILKAAGAKE
jgi:ankyrin repeat protein